LNPAQVKKIKALLSKPKNIVIVTHWSPDGDAIGSSLGLYNYLLKKKHKVTVITPNDYPDFLKWMKGEKKILNFQEKQAAAKKQISKAELIFCLDFNSLKRIDQLGDLVSVSTAIKFIIDHHPQPDTFADYMLHSVSACSTCELVYDFINLMSDRKVLDKDIAGCLYTGIMTDTGSFRYPSTTSKTHLVLSDLIKAGAENAEIHNLVYDGNSESKLKLLGYCLNEKLTVLPTFKTAFFSLSEEELKRFNYKKGDTEGVVNYALSIAGIRFAGFFVERDGVIKTSFRSKGSFDVNKFARANFNGGGHVNAAGGMSELSLEKTLEKFVSLLPEYVKQLNAKK
jgi:bifunctional oligoribonuclease and PAP phosphatase NrnA